MADKRVRSPNYPAISLPDAVQRVGDLYKAQHTHAAPREVVAKGLGYTGLNGASATTISAMHKYGLLERAGDEIKVSDRAMRILFPNADEEKSLALREAAFEPALFSELSERFPGSMPSEELLRNYLMRNGFAAGAVSAVILSYRDTMDLVNREGRGYDLPMAVATKPDPSFHPPATIPSATVPPAGPLVHVLQQDERIIGRYDFEDGAFVQIIASEDVPTEEALEWAEVVIANKRRELKKRTLGATSAESGAEKKET